MRTIFMLLIAMTAVAVPMASAKTVTPIGFVSISCEMGGEKQIQTRSMFNKGDNLVEADKVIVSGQVAGLIMSGQASQTNMGMVFDGWAQCDTFNGIESHDVAGVSVKVPSRIGVKARKVSIELTRGNPHSIRDDTGTMTLTLN